jgi:hypothetical protein
MKLVRRLCCLRASDGSSFRTPQVALVEDPVGQTPDSVGSAPDPLLVLVPDGLPLFWPPFEVDMSEGEARFETTGPGKTYSEPELWTLGSKISGLASLYAPGKETVWLGVPDCEPPTRILVQEG